jgi:hypothetical protein
LPRGLGAGGGEDLRKRLKLARVDIEVRSAAPQMHHAGTGKGGAIVAAYGA